MTLTDVFSTLWKRYPVEIAGLSLSGILMLAAAVLFIRSMTSGSASANNSIEPIPTNQIKTKTNESDEKIIIAIDISGGVKRPGVYDLRPGARIADAIAAAGGLSEDADLSEVERNINRSRFVTDGEKIYIPKKGDPTTLTGASIYSPYNTHQEKAPVSSIDINSAEKSVLESLPGIGPKTAEKIIDNRPYSSIQELLERKVIGQKTFDSISEMISASSL